MDEWIRERYELAKARVSEIKDENTVKEPYLDFFHKTASFLEETVKIMEQDTRQLSLEVLENQNRMLYEDVFPENYGRSYGNPAYAQERLGEYGNAFTFLYAEIRGAVAYAFEKKIWDMTVILELFLEVYSAFEDEELPEASTVEQILRSYVNDYCQDMMEQRIREGIDPELDFAARIIMNADLTDIRYLYQYGEYVSENEIRVSQFLAGLSQEEIEDMASTFTEGYRIGFILGRKDLSKKKTVNIRYNLGFERMVKAAVEQFRAMGLKPVIYRHATHAVSKKNQLRIGYTGGVANPQYDYDHRQDCALFLDGDFVQKKLRAMQVAYEKYADLAAVHGGPACIETFGEAPFSPVNKAEGLKLSDSQQKLQVELDNESSQIVNRYIK